MSPNNKHKFLFIVKKNSNPLKNLELSSEELKAIAKIRGIKGYKRMSEDELLRSLTPSKLVKKLQKQNQNFLNQE